MIPKTEKALKKDYEDCEKHKIFVYINRDSYIDYLNESQSDLASAQKELEYKNYKWALIKIYQSLFLACNAILIKNAGFYSKDHRCLITALMRNNLISERTLFSIRDVTEKNLFEEINEARLERNQAMYFPKTQRKLEDTQIVNSFNEIKRLISILMEEI